MMYATMMKAPALHRPLLMVAAEEQQVGQIEMSDSRICIERG